MRLKVQHTTSFQYDAPVYETQTEIRLRPSDSPLADQRVLDFHIHVEPHAPLFMYTDYFGNSVTHFNILKEHRDLQIVSSALVITGGGQSEAGPVDEIRSLDFLGESRYALIDDSLRDFAAGIDQGGEPESTALALCRRIRDTFAYVPGATDVHSTSSQVIGLHRGVCQDFAHVLIAACRLLGVPARYVSGYLFDRDRLSDSDGASHAWCEVYAGQERGWAGFDPTHDPFAVDERYIKIGTGRDYGDVTPVRGTYKGAATEHLKVVVEVCEA